MPLLESKVAIITGAASGIGRATALRFCEEGASVVVADVQEDAGAAVLKEMEAAGGTGLFFRTDVSQPDQVQSLIRNTVDSFGQLDILMNNAGIEGDYGKMLEDCTFEDWDRVLTVNLRGIFTGLKYGLPELVKTKGVAINTASLAGIAGFPGMSPYTAAKGGVVALTRSAALEYAQFGVRVNCICPGAVMTEMVQRLVTMSPDPRLPASGAIPLGRPSQPVEIANAAVYLASDLSSFVTGTALTVDGGVYAM